MTITRLAIDKKFESIEIVPIIYTHLVHFTITHRPTVTKSGSLTQHSPWFRQQLAKRRTVLNMIALNVLEAQSIASGQEQEDTPVKSRSFRSVSVSDPSSQANLRWWMITVSLILWMVCNKTGKLHVFSHFILSRFNYTFGPEFVKIDLIIICCCAGGPLDRLVLRMRG